MKNYYALIRFNGAAVSGFLAIGHKDTESARLSIIKALTEEINALKEHDDKGGYVGDKIQRLRAFRRSFTKPHRKYTKKLMGGEIIKVEPVLEMIELPNDFVIATNHWLSHKSDENTGYLCNLPRNREEHPKGYVISQLK